LAQVTCFFQLLCRGTGNSDFLISVRNIPMEAAWFWSCSPEVVLVHWHSMCIVCVLWNLDNNLYIQFIP